MSKHYLWSFAGLLSTVYRVSIVVTLESLLFNVYVTLQYHLSLYFARSWFLDGIGTSLPLWMRFYCSLFWYETKTKLLGRNNVVEFILDYVVMWIWSICRSQLRTNHTHPMNYWSLTTPVWTQFAFLDYFVFNFDYNFHLIIKSIWWYATNIGFWLKPQSLNNRAQNCGRRNVHFHNPIPMWWSLFISWKTPNLVWLNPIIISKWDCSMIKTCIP